MKPEDNDYPHLDLVSKDFDSLKTGNCNNADCPVCGIEAQMKRLKQHKQNEKT